MNPVNLIPKARRQRQDARRRQSRWFRFLRVYAIVLAIGCALAMVPAHAATPSLESSIARLDRRIESMTTNLEESKRNANALGRQLDLARAVSDHPDWSFLLSAIARVRSQDAVLESFDLSFTKIEDKPAKSDAKTPAGGAKPVSREFVLVKLSGFCPAPASCFQFAHALEQLDLFERVTVKDTRAQAIGAYPATRFEIEATMPAAPSPQSAPPAPTAPSTSSTPTATHAPAPSTRKVAPQLPSGGAK